MAHTHRLNSDTMTTLTSPWCETPPALLASIWSIVEPHTTGHDRLIANLPTGSVDFARYDHGWSIVGCGNTRFNSGGSCMSRKELHAHLRTIIKHGFITVTRYHTDPNPTMKFHTSPEEETTAPLTSSPSTLNSQLSTLFTYRSYQREDLARAALRDGCIIGWDPGMGKTMAIFTLPFLKKARFALIVAPGGLHEQIIDEGRTKFGVNVTPIPDQETALRMMRDGTLPLPGQCPGELPDEPAFFITSYTALGYNGADEWQADEPNDFLRDRRLCMLRQAVAFPDPEQAHRMATAAWKTKQRVSDWEALTLPENASDAQVRMALRTGALLFHPHVRGEDVDCHWRWHRMRNAAQALLHLSDAAMDKVNAVIDTDPALTLASAALTDMEQGIGLIKDGIKCIFRPTLASILTPVFDFIVCDEAVRLKSGSSYQAQGVLRMTGRYRYALTGTAIKNRLPDFFFLACWVAGFNETATARWPYANKMEDRGQFSRDFGVLEENITAGEKAQQNGKVPPRPKPTAQICNVHRLFRIIGPVFIGRKKDDVPDCNLVAKTIVPVRVMPGKKQQVVYQYHLHNRPEKRSLLASIGCQLQYLRQAALNPGTAALPAGPKSRSASPWTPKHIGILQLATDLLEQGEQLVIFSPFCDFGAGLSDRFTEAGIPHLKLDGTTSPAKRGTAVKRFKSGEVPILIAGIDSMGEGHSLDTCSHLVLPSLSWAFDSNSQAVERVHRLTSKKDVTIYVMVTKGTIDERLVSMWQEKGDSADLALYGRLSTHDRQEIDLGQLLRDAVTDFDPTAQTLDEDEVSVQWRDTIRPALAASMAGYRRLRPLAVSGEPLAVKEKRPVNSSLPLPTANRQPPTLPQPRPRTLFDLMNQKRNQATPPPAAPIPTPPPAPSPQPLRNIIPFPGRLAAATGKKPVALLNTGR